MLVLVRYFTDNSCGISCGYAVVGNVLCHNAPRTDNTSKTYKVGICNYVDDASLNQIVANIKSQLEKIGTEKNVKFDIEYDNCNADKNVLSQIITNFVAEKVDLMVGVATPVATAMQAATAENKIPVVFSAVSDPMSVELVSSLEKPGANITGTSDFLNTDAIFDIMFAQNPDIKTVGLLYDVGQDSSATPIASAKAYLDKKGVAYKEYTGTTVDEVRLAAQSAVLDKVDAVFTPTDNTIMKSELSIYETFAQAKIPHYTGADRYTVACLVLKFFRSLNGLNLCAEGRKCFCNCVIVKTKLLADVGVYRRLLHSRSRRRRGRCNKRTPSFEHPRGNARRNAFGVYHGVFTDANGHKQSARGHYRKYGTLFD